VDVEAIHKDEYQPGAAAASSGASAS